MTLAQICSILNFSRQTEHGVQKRRKHKKIDFSDVLEKVQIIRSLHPRLGCRKLYTLIRPRGLGRDRFEQLLEKHKLQVKTKKNYKRTTYSVKSKYHPNIIAGMELSDINQVLQTDTTYFYLNGKHYYITFIVDVYSRRIIGYEVSTSLRATANVNALKMALTTRKSLKGAIHHSDRGGQFISKEYKEISAKAKLIPSMCKTGLENAYAERVNGIIKNEYLYAWRIKDYNGLKKAVKIAVDRYNHFRPHSSLNMLTPVAFESKLLTLCAENKPKVKIYTDAKRTVVGASSPFQQCRKLPKVQ